MILVTGGAGFIGANFVLDWIHGSAEALVNVDSLTYAGNLDNLAAMLGDARHIFVQSDIRDGALIGELLTRYRPRAIIHFAAETQVDRSIQSPVEFIDANVGGTFSLLEAARDYWAGLDERAKVEFRFLHISTDEVYGTLAADDAPFTETTAYRPNSPYAASKAAADHLVRAFYQTYGLPTLITNCSNNFGPFQFPEKLIPLVIANALGGKPVPIYGDGMNVRDWLYVSDHCSAIRAVLAHGRVGDTYNVGGGNEMTNLRVVETLCGLLDVLRPRSPALPHARLITFVKDRPGHDRRYAVDARKIERELGWRPGESFDSGIAKTVDWYLANAQWLARVQSGEYRARVAKQYDSVS